PDELLRRVAAQLRDSVRSHDTVARTGGDEFTILIEDLTDRRALDAVFKRIRNALTVRFAWDANTVDVALSAGAAVAPLHGVSERDLTAAADLALYHMKEEQGASLALYEPSFGEAAQERNRVIADARAALIEGKIVPHYQPQVDIASGRVVGVEALARWTREDTILCASEFADALHDHDIGPMIGQAVVERALMEIAALNHGRRDKIALSVNASAGELLRNEFLERVGRLAPDTAERGPITIELTEDVILDDPKGVLSEAMRRVGRDSAVSFSLDDFGTGYGSLVHITSLPISEVKVDRRFVAGLETDPQKGKIIKGILDVARSLKVRVVLEGVETREQAEMINALGGRYVQGFYYAR
ncbi:MAG: bifunctional diguanylate cyclase/phosphodiesterase, partial [Pseudomonadota bacterium]